MQWWKASGLTLVLAASGCNTTPVQDGAVVGAALGSAAGAVIGHQSGQQGEGALIGAGTGALIGALVGDQVDRRPQAGYAQPAPQQPQVRRQSAPGPARLPSQGGHYETRVVTAPSGEKYEERVWVAH